jgi:acetyltransferase-like isoleucine patch superfamily enzyme
MSRRFERLRVTLRLIAGRLRAEHYRRLGARIGARSTIDRDVRIDRPWGFTAGERVELERGAFLKLVHDDARLTLGGYVFIGAGCEIDVALTVTIGDHTLLAPGVFITDHTHNAEAGELIDRQGSRSAAVHVGSDVWIGARATILHGVSIGDGAIIGAGSVVTRDVASNSIVAGVPARFLRQRGTGDAARQAAQAVSASRE